MKKLLLIVGILSYLHSAKAQNKISKCLKVFYHSSEISDTSCDGRIKNVRQTSSGRILLKYKDKSKAYIREDSVWGIRARNGTIYRIANGTDYQLEQTVPVFKYSRKTGKTRSYYFSATSDGPIYRYHPDLLKKYTDSATYNGLVAESKKNRHEISIDIAASGTRILKNDLPGFAFGVRYFPTARWGTGIMLSVAVKKVRDTFGYSVIQPQLGYYEFAWANEYRLINKERFLLGIEMLSGLSIAQLRDKAVLEKTRSRGRDRYIPKEIVTDYYFLVKPAVNVSYKFISNKHYPDFFLTGKLAEAFNFGNNSMSPHSSKALNFSVGLSLIGWDKMQF